MKFRGGSRIQKEPISVVVPERFPIVMRPLEPRMLLDAAGGDDAVSLLSSAVHGSMADAYFDHDAPTTIADNQSWSRIVEALEHVPPVGYEPQPTSERAPREIAFLVADVPESEQLASLLPRNVEIIFLEDDQDTLGNIVKTLAERSDLEAIHIISHGSEGSLSLGEAHLTSRSMVSTYAEQLRAIGQSLSDSGDILIYGCDFAAGDTGLDAMNVMAELTGADIAASDDKTGHADLDGNWVLELSTGIIEATVFNPGSAWFATLDDPVITSNGSSSVAHIIVDENQTFVTTITAIDDDLPGDILTYSISGGFDETQFIIDAMTGELRFLNVPDFENPTDFIFTDGIYSVRVLVTDQDGGSDSQFITVEVADKEEAPIATHDTFIAPMNGSVSINVLANDIDPEGDNIEIILVEGQPISDGSAPVNVTNGSVLQSGNNLVFSPAANYLGPVSFSYNVADTNGNISVATVLGTVTNGNTAPIAVDKAYLLQEDETATGNALTDDTGSGSHSDPDGDAISLASISIGTSATLQGGSITLSSGGSFTYIPPTNFYGTDSFVYGLTDGTVAQSALLTFQVTPINDAPLATDDTYLIGPDTPLSGNVISDGSVGGSDGDPDGDAISLAASSIGAFATEWGGTVSLTANGAFNYSPPPGFSGMDSFAYSITDGDLTDTANVTFVVGSAPVPSADPVIVPATGNSTETIPQPTIISPLKVLPEAIQPPAENLDLTIELDGLDINEQSDPPTPEFESPNEIDIPQLSELPPEAPASPPQPPAVAINPQPPVLVQPPQVEEETEKPDEPPVESPPEIVPQSPEPIALPPTLATITDYNFDPVNYTIFDDRLNQTVEDIRQYKELLGTTTAHVTFAFGTIVGVGSVSWLLQSGILAATFLSALPAWRRFDPIEIVSDPGDDEGDGKQSDIQEMMDQIQTASARASKGARS